MHMGPAFFGDVYLNSVCIRSGMDDRLNATPPRFWDRRAARYAAKPVPDEEAYRLTLDRVRVHLTPRDRVLELGSGTGTTALKLADCAREILAIDYSTEMISIATAKAGAAGVSNVHFRIGSVDDPALAPASFDVVMAMNLLHLLPDLPRQLRLIHGLVRPGGLFVSKTSCVGDQGLAIRLAIPLMRVLGIAPYVNFVTERSLIRDLAHTGFEVLETGMYPRKSRSFFVVARRRS
jgi:2-polyprenyl-3-methyl-5-hydroxy-6-metoxy-1,4-benzoquinol methylase